MWRGIEGPERSLFWASYCANKRGVTLDLESEAGVARLRSLAAAADIIIESFRPGYMAGLGLGYDELSAENPALVYTSITPFGQTGPYSQFALLTWWRGLWGGCSTSGGTPTGSR